MNKAIPLVVHTSNEDMFFTMMNAKTQAHVAEMKKQVAVAERDMAVLQLMSAKEEMQQKEALRIRRNRFILKTVVFGLCVAGCVASAAVCICNGLWYTTFAPAALIAASALNLKK